MRSYRTTTLSLLAILIISGSVTASQWLPHNTRNRQHATTNPTLFKPAKLVFRGGSSDDEGKATIMASVFNLVNNVAGAGILTLSAGMASGSGYIPAMLICAVLGALSGHSFSIIGDACELTGEVDFKVRSIGVMRSIRHMSPRRVGTNLRPSFQTGFMGQNDWRKVYYLGRCHDCCHVSRLCRHILWYLG